MDVDIKGITKTSLSPIGINTCYVYRVNIKFMVTLIFINYKINYFETK